MIHGKQTAQEKQLALTQFKTQEVDILVATSVIEVGINNPNATVMAIFNPERFGLSSLHQLRGRVARGDKNGFCFLLVQEKLSIDSLDRLKIMEETNDGFRIAQADLLSRGQGNLFGKEQSGKSSYNKIANIIIHNEIFEQVAKDLEEILRKKPDLIDRIISDLLDENNITSII
jgi:ATP-dependent DNA helicase RecG